MELGGIGETLRRTRLVTLTGPGGVEKTRVRHRVRPRSDRETGGWVWLVDLTAGPADPDPAAELARTLGVGGRSATEPTESLRRYRADRDVLLVIDNCEHVIDACAELASSLLGSCGNLRILATSRESLGVSGETVWRLDALAAEEFARRLFVERARQRNPRFIWPNKSARSTTATDDSAVPRLRRPYLRALAERPGDGLGGRAHAELGFQAREPLADGVKAEEQLPSDVRLVLHRRGGAQHLGLARGQPEAVERVRRGSWRPPPRAAARADRRAAAGR